MFLLPRSEQPNLVLGKLRDLGTLALVGLTLMLSVVLSGAVTGFSGQILGWVGIDPDATVPTVLVSVLGHALAVVASTVLLMAMFKLLLTHSHLPRRALLEGALLGAVGFELLKLVANLLLGTTEGSPAFQAFGVALILVVWINYFSRLVMYAAAWSYTAPVAQRLREAEALIAPGAGLAAEPAGAAAGSGAAVAARAGADQRPGVRRVVGGAALLAGLVAVVRHRSRPGA
jgi:membrane protein